jgi:HEAT repeat protein
VLGLIKRDEDVLVRSWLLKWEERLRGTRPGQAAAMRATLAQDPSPRIRGHAIQAMVDTNDGRATDRLREALFDASPFVRYVARFYLQKRNGETDFASVYRRALSEHGKQSTIAITGLGETGQPSDCELIIPFLRGTPRQARAALRAAAKLDAQSSHGVLVAALADERTGVCREALALLTRRLPEDDADALDALWPQATTSTSRHAIAEAMLRLPPWPAALALLRAVAADSGPGAEAAASALARWRPEHRALYAPLPPAEFMRERLVDALAAVSEILTVETSNRVGKALRQT